MKIISAFIVAIFLIQIFGCKNPVENKPPVEELTKNGPFIIDVDNSRDLIDLKLSDLADSFRLVRLETSDKAIISANDYYVSDKYIIAFSQDGIYMFSSNGKFIIKIAGYGRGPDEISGFYFAHFYDERNDLLYFNDVNLNKKLLVYDLSKKKFRNPIKKAIQGLWGSFAVDKDSLIMGQTPIYSDEPYIIFFQTFDGKLVSGIPYSKKALMGSKHVETFQKSYTIIGEKNYRISFEFNDTLFTFKNNQIEPFIILDFNKPRDILPSYTVQTGDRAISFPRIEAQSFFVITVSVYEEVIWLTETTSKDKKSRKYIFLNKSTGKYATIRTYEDDFSGRVQSSKDGAIEFPRILKNGKLVVVYQPNTIKKIAEQKIINPIFTPNLDVDLLNVNKDLQETDNPILLIGRIKEKI